MTTTKKPVTPVVDRFFYDRLQTLPCQAWRDLYWLLHTQPLLAPGFSHAYPPARFPVHCLQSITQWMVHEHQHPLALTPHTQTHFRRLGLYAEHLLKLGLAHCPDLKLLLHHHPIHLEPIAPEKGRKTLGEVDYIWQDRKTGTIHHWELAVKLYLFLPRSEAPDLPGHESTNNELHRYVGTQLHDTLYRKTQRLFGHQLQLSAHEHITAKLGRQVNQSGVYLKGWLFYPLLDQDWNSYLYPGTSTLECLNPEHNKGWWLRFSHFLPRLAGQSTSIRWLILPRLYWLSEAWASAPQTLDAAQLAHQLEQHFLANNPADAPAASHTRPEPLLLAALQEDPTHPGLYREIHRGFVTGNTWARA
ncbi:hypothetical protein GCM10011450_28310 [Advenella faeciporci]|uniref:DUF1853 family protein n=1 Tax=Advenella faeciporci TaxID=797535 RepID=A0A918N219_9BURK|nr:DUF1853 family protein [Advenella faeciporci]GGW97173.1 hypothetical protein GCM10011450_28310 [Advenella faeciporci]